MMLSMQQQQEPPPQRGLSERALDHLPEVIIDKTLIEQSRSHDGEAMCAICHEDYVVGDRVLQLPCEHIFCVDCGRQWLQRNCTCPFCRREVEVCTDEEVEERDDAGSGWHSQDL